MSGAEQSSALHAPAHHESVYPDVEQPEPDEGGAAPPAQMPPGRGTTYAMGQQDPYWDNHAAIQSGMQQYRNAALLHPAYRGGLKTKTLPEGGASDARAADRATATSGGESI